ncbi:MAG TPA: tetratricopeptide repeat protein [Candidatus Brocadiia bacterium]|nr:tetratricopeptide repeat protein [Candidatus Brocadiia bacterium]
MTEPITCGQPSGIEPEPESLPGAGQPASEKDPAGGRTARDERLERAGRIIESGAQSRARWLPLTVFLTGFLTSFWAPAGARAMASGLERPWTAAAIAVLFGVGLAAGLGLLMTRPARGAEGLVGNCGRMLCLGLFAGAVIFRYLLLDWVWAWLLPPVGVGFWTAAAIFGLQISTAVRMFAGGKSATGSGNSGLPPGNADCGSRSDAEIKTAVPGVMPARMAGDIALGFLCAAILFAFVQIHASPVSAVISFTMALSVGLWLGLEGVRNAPVRGGGAWRSAARIGLALCGLAWLLKRGFLGFPAATLSVGAVSLSPVCNMGAEYTFPLWLGTVALGFIFCLWNDRSRHPSWASGLAFPWVSSAMIGACAGLAGPALVASYGIGTTLSAASVCAAFAVAACAVCNIRSTGDKAWRALLPAAIALGILICAETGDWQDSGRPLRKLLKEYADECALKIDAGSVPMSGNTEIIRSFALPQRASASASGNAISFLRGDVVSAPNAPGIAPAMLSAALPLTLLNRPESILLADIRPFPVREAISLSPTLPDVAVVSGAGALRKALFDPGAYDAIVLSPLFVSASDFPEEFYSLQFMQLCLGRLKKDGLFQTWIPLREMRPEHLRRAIAGVRRAFPATYLWECGDSLIITGLNGKTGGCLDRMAGLYRVPRFASAMAMAGMAEPFDALATCSVGPRRLPELLGDAAPISLGNSLWNFRPRLSLNAPPDLMNMTLVHQFRLVGMAEAWKLAAGSDDVKLPPAFGRVYAARTLALFDYVETQAELRAVDLDAFLASPPVRTDLVDGWGPTPFGLRAEFYFQLGLNRRALKELSKYLQSNQENAYLHCRIGQAFRRLKDKGQALRHLGAACKINLRLAEPRLEIAGLLMESNDMRGAAEALEEAVAGEPDCLQAWLDLALARIQLHESDNAAEALRRAEILDPGNPDALRLRRLLRK